jgi:alpha-glucosidase (family GH31 glycosyl hydrolase)
MFGPDLLVAPVINEEAFSRNELFAGLMVLRPLLQSR